jgi:hypothetical protein
MYYVRSNELKAELEDGSSKKEAVTAGTDGDIQLKGWLEEQIIAIFRLNHRCS